MVLNDNIIHLKTSFLVWMLMNNKSPHIGESRRTSRESRRFRRSRGSSPTRPHTSQPRDRELLLFDLNKDLKNE